MLRFRNICFKSKRNRSNTIFLYPCRGHIYFRQKLATHVYDVLYIQYLFSIYIYRGVKLDLSMSPLQCKQVFQSILIKLLLHCILFHAIEKSVRVRSDQYMA